ncbi:hypothetical protein SHAQ108633_08810 [Shewanella aquimarina]
MFRQSLQGMYLRRLTGVSARKVAHSHPCDRDIGASMHCTFRRQFKKMKVNATLRLNKSKLGLLANTAI